MLVTLGWLQNDGRRLGTTSGSKFTFSELMAPPTGEKSGHTEPLPVRAILVLIFARTTD